MSYRVLCRVINALEDKRLPHPFSVREPQFGKRGLYREIGDADQIRQLAMLWVLSLADARTSVLSIAERSGMEFEVVREVASVLITWGILEETDGSDSTLSTFQTRFDAGVFRLVAGRWPFHRMDRRKFCFRSRCQGCREPGS